jgi:hypothetical protein
MGGSEAVIKIELTRKYVSEIFDVLIFFRFTEAPHESNRIFPVVTDKKNEWMVSNEFWNKWSSPETPCYKPKGCNNNEY